MHETPCLIPIIRLQLYSERQHWTSRVNKYKATTNEHTQSATCRNNCKYRTWDPYVKDENIKVKIPRKCNNHEAQPSAGIRRRRDEGTITTKEMAHFNQKRNDKEELRQRNRLQAVSRKATGWLKSVLLARNVILNSDAALNYKYMFGLHYSETHILWTTVK